MTAPHRRQSRPVAACVRCGRVHSAGSETTVICSRPEPGGGICGGRITWRTNPNDWSECPQCDASGTRDGAACQRCYGDGWLLGRAD